MKPNGAACRGGGEGVEGGVMDRVREEARRNVTNGKTWPRLFTKS